MKIEEFTQLYLDLAIDLEDGVSGQYELRSFENQPGTKLSVIPKNYQSLLLGHTPKDVVLEKPYRQYEIMKGNERVMTNLPWEMYKLFHPYLKSNGKILIGGYGMGLLTRLICEKESVEYVVSIEYSKDILNLCPFEHPKLELLEMDFFDYLHNEDLNNFDYIFVDIYVWGDEYYQNVLIPTRNYLLENYPNVRFDFWQEDLLKINYLSQNNRLTVGRP